MAPLRSLLFVLALSGCGGGPAGGPGGPEGPGGPGPDVIGPDGRRPSDALQPAPDPSRDQSSLQAAGPERVVTITLSPGERPDTGQFVFVGVPADGIEEGWLKAGRRPSFFWVSPLMSLEGTVTLVAPLPAGLHYFAVLNLDGDDLPGPDDRVSGPVFQYPEGEGAELHFTVGARLGDVLPADTDEDEGEDEPRAGDEGGEVRTLIIGNDVRLPFIRTGRFAVVGLPPSPEDEFGFPPDATPSFLWISEATRLKWPVELQAKLPDAVDLLVVLDLDASGEPDVGDLTTEPMFAFRRPPAGEAVTVTLQTVIPVAEGDANEERPRGDGEEVEGPAEPGDEDEDGDADPDVAPAAERTPPPLPPGAILVAPGTPTPTAILVAPGTPTPVPAATPTP